ncbi:uncharacterized protein LOC120314955 [Crotalus tigris]|uniref:uncharacterized protein LOC120314955 n=1 Tax=Crotalus tigris TaxID=88082 RepID=UPI00192F8384|nr:uncharacterized protein LOC120314955 [Crotalus tigris]
MRRSLVGLQLFLACVLVWGTSVEEEKKECCGPGVPPEKSCCPKENSTSQEPAKEGPEEPNSEELEENAKEYRERMQRNSESSFEFTFLKEQAMNYFNKRNPDTFYRPIEDINIKVQSAVGTMLSFPLFLVNTNCTKEQGRESAVPWYRRRSSKAALCVALPKQEQKKWKCRVHMFVDARSRQSAVVRQDCEPVVVWEDSTDTVDVDHLMDFSDGPFF